MASQGYYDWLNAGKPYALVRPLAKTQANIRRHGLTVYDYPDNSHLLASKPEDHTSFSYTGWPNAYTRWKGRAIDIMPRDDSAAARAENTKIALQIIRDKDADYPGARWVKYINYTDDDGHCWHVSWQPTKSVTSSGDMGHVHVSGRSDMDDYAGADDYDPVARMNGDDDMLGQAGIKIEATESSIAVPGGANRRRLWLVLTNDTGIFDHAGPDYALRIVAKPYNKPWVFINDDGRVGGVVANGVVRIKNGETMSWPLPDDTRCVSIVRQKIGDTEPYAGPLTAALEM